jgi:hypothetical protein
MPLRDALMRFAAQFRELTILSKAACISGAPLAMIRLKSVLSSTSFCEIAMERLVMLRPVCFEKLSARDCLLAFAISAFSVAHFVFFSSSRSKVSSPVSLKKCVLSSMLSNRLGVLSATRLA